MSQLSALQVAPCLVCGCADAKHRGLLVIEFDCPRCGIYRYEQTEAWLKIESQDHIVKLAGWIRDQNRSGVHGPSISTEISQRINTNRPNG